jgi:putative membrane protein
MQALSISKSQRGRWILDSNYPGRHRGIHLFGWIIIGLLTLLVVGSLVLWGISLATGHAPFLFFPRAYPLFFFFPFGFIFFLFFIFFIVRLVFWGGGWWGRGRYRGYYYWGDAKEVLRQRYARGEITKEQFDQMNRDLDERK